MEQNYEVNSSSWKTQTCKEKEERESQPYQCQSIHEEKPVAAFGCNELRDRSYPHSHVVPCPRMIEQSFWLHDSRSTSPIVKVIYLRLCCRYEFPGVSVKLASCRPIQMSSSLRAMMLLHNPTHCTRHHHHSLLYCTLFNLFLFIDGAWWWCGALPCALISDNKTRGLRLRNRSALLNSIHPSSSQTLRVTLHDHLHTQSCVHTLTQLYATLVMFPSHCRHIRAPLEIRSNWTTIDHWNTPQTAIRLSSFVQARPPYW